MKTGVEVLGEGLPLDCRHYIRITYCLNCDEAIRNERGELAEYCNDQCQNEHELIKKYV